MEHVLSHIKELAAYVPGEQPQEGGFVKLNTNENPYPPSAKVCEAISAELGRLRLYPDPANCELRRAASEVYGVPLEWTFAGNGSDEILTLLCRAFLDREHGACYPVPSYTLYRTLAATQDAPVTEIPFTPAWRLPASELVSSGAVVAFIANPNSPTGTAVEPLEIYELARSFKGLVVADEAYADYADANSLPLVRELTNLAVLRSLSKSYALAGLRVGLLIGRPELVAVLMKLKDSYNLDRLAQAGAAAALRDRGYFETLRARVLESRQKLVDGLKSRGFSVLPSQANFVCAQPPPHIQPGAVYERLKERKILVRFFPKEMPSHLRISVGTEPEVSTFLNALDTIFKEWK